MDVKRHLDSKVIAEIKRLHFHIKHLLSHGIAGRYRSSYRGTGVEFEDIREYISGDDVRSIDWKVTARTKKPFIKTYQEERELTVLIAVDVSSSTQCGTKGMLREKLISQISAALTFIALNNNDKVGLLTFSDKVHSYFPPRKAPSVVWKILHEIFADRTKEKRQTDLSSAILFLSKVLKKKAVIFLISDFIDKKFQDKLNVLSKKHDITAVLIKDAADINFPAVGLLRLSDPESGLEYLIDSSDNRFQKLYAENSQRYFSDLKQYFQRQKIDLLELSTEQFFVPDLKKFFDKRISHGR